MALTLVLTYSSVTSDDLSHTFTDDTVYGGDEYLRNQVAIIVKAQKSQLPDESDIDLTIVGDQSDPTLDSSWIVTSENDGWHTLPMYAIPIYSSLATYSIDQVVFYSGALYKCIQQATDVTPGSDPLYWTQINIDDDIDDVEAADNVQYEYQQFVLTSRLEKCYSKATAMEATDGCCEGCENAELKQTAEKLHVLLNGIFVECGRLKYAEAEEIVRNMTYICEKSKCICD